MLLKPKAATIPWNWARFHDVCVKCRTLMILVGLHETRRPHQHTHTRIKWLISRTPTTWMPFFIFLGRTLKRSCRLVVVQQRKFKKKVKMSWKTRYKTVGKVFWFFFLIFLFFFLVCRWGLEVFSSNQRRWNCFGVCQQSGLDWTVWKHLLLLSFLH